jgi:hypothetical protein
MVDQTFDARRMARDQESRIAAAAALGLSAIRPIVQFQASLLRLWADNVELLARNYERGIETFTSAAEQQWQQQRAA